MAFEASGLSLDQVARLVDVSPNYVKHLLRRGAQSFCTAERLRRALNCRVELFLPNRNLVQKRNQVQKRKEVSDGRPERANANH